MKLDLLLTLTQHRLFLSFSLGGECDRIINPINNLIKSPNNLAQIRNSILSIYQEKLNWEEEKDIMLQLIETVISD